MFKRFKPQGQSRNRRRWGAWRCAGLALLTLVGFMFVNVAGCGGGGGGGVDTAGTAEVTIVLRDINGNAINGTVTLAGRTLTTTGGRVTFTEVRPGVYTVRYTVAGQTTESTLVVGNDRRQTFVASPGGASNANIVVRGRVLLNTGDGTTINCNASSVGVSAPVLIRVRDLNTAGRPIVVSFVKPDQGNLSPRQQGNYTIFGIPRTGTYLVEVRTAPNSIAPFSGNSAAFTVRNGQVIDNLNICVNPSNNTPGGTPPPPPVTPTATGDVTPTGTPNATTTGTPNATTTGTPNATTTGTPNATTTATGIPTPTGNPTFTPTPSATPTPTGRATPTPTPTITPIPSPSPTGPPGPGSVYRKRGR